MRRILTAFLLIPLTVGLVLWAHPYLLVAVQLVITLTALWEFFRLAEAATDAKVLRGTGYAFATAVALCPLTGSLPTNVLMAAVFFLMMLLVVAMSPRREIKGYLASVSTTLFGVVYVAVPLSLLVWVCLQEDGRFLILFALVVIWVSDSAAYFVGRTWGKHKSSPRISPNKTWEGTVTSLAAALLVGLLYAQFLWGVDPYWEPVLLAAFLNVAGQLGDLGESALKRSAGVKDSSHLLPGHGGVLDRIDALLLAAPVLWYYWLGKGS